MIAVATDEDVIGDEMSKNDGDVTVEEELIDPEDLEVFMPTDKWQPIKAGW